MIHPRLKIYLMQRQRDNICNSSEHTGPWRHPAKPHPSKECCLWGGCHSWAQAAMKKFLTSLTTTRKPQTITGSEDAKQSGPWPESLISLHGYHGPPKLSIYKYPDCVADSGEGQEILQSNWHPILHTKLSYFLDNGKVVLFIAQLSLWSRISTVLVYSCTLFCQLLVRHLKIKTSLKFLYH